MRFGVADYGLNQWYGGCFDYESRLRAVKQIGYDGLERLEALSPADAVHKAALFRRAGMDFATCRGPTIQASIHWTAALGKHYVWAAVTGRDFDTFCRQVNEQVAACELFGLAVGLHNHLGSLVESQQQVEQFLARCPDCGLILDTAHLAAADGHPVDIVRKYADRLVAIHLKDWIVENKDVGLDRWTQRGRFCELGAGNIGLDNAAVMKALAEVGYDGWVHVEQDTHLRDPMQDLAQSRQYLRDAGY
jgi:sugar phosphate isomerase/epimerase